MSRLPRVAIKGARGVWTAEVGGDRLAVLHDTWRQGTDGYHDPMNNVALEGKKYRALVGALRAHDRAVLQRDKGEGLQRDGYVGVFSFRDLHLHGDGAISLTIVERVAEAAR